jgi:hypothetical protein
MPAALEETLMNRSKDVSGMGAACVLALGAVLAGCAQRNPSSSADPAAALAHPSVSIEAASGALGRTSPPHDESRTPTVDLPIVVITGHRRVLLSEQNPGSARD